MPRRSTLNRPRSQWHRLAGIALPSALAMALLAVIEAYHYLLPEWLLHLIQRLLLATPALGLFWLLLRRPTHFLDVEFGDRPWERLDRAASWTFDRLPALLLAAAVILLAGWLPHYLQWPWWTDTDHFAVSAQSWDSGILPYRDLLDFNFPGPTYVFWLLGNTLGWGRTAPFYAFDAALLLALGVAMACWSRQRTGKLTSGLLGYVLFLVYYLRLDLSLVAQRDWQAPCFAVLGLLALDARPACAPRLASALLLVAAITFRPHAILFLPAYAWALWRNLRDDDHPHVRPLPALAGWALTAILASLIAASPLLIAGIADDLARSLLGSAWYGQSYHRDGYSYERADFLRDLKQWTTLGVLLSLLLLARLGSPSQRRSALTWALAMAGMLLYKPLSPVVFAYHHHAIMVTAMIGVAVLASCIENMPYFSISSRFFLLSLLVLLSADGRPRFWSATRSAQAILSLARGEPPEHSPPGSARYLPDAGTPGARVHWEEYQSTLDYLRRRTSRTTRVAHLIRSHPCPPVNGPTGRLTPYPCAEGIQWLRWVAPERERQFAETLLQHDETVVVWDPAVKDFAQLAKTVRDHYVPEAIFGDLEIWRRRTPAAALVSQTLTPPPAGHPERGPHR